jgi:alpha-galactosidase
LETDRTAYVLGLDKDGNLGHVYWGSRLELDTDYAGVGAARQWPFERSRDASRQEYSAWGGVNYNEPGLKATFADGTRAVELAYAAASVAEERGLPCLVIALRDTHYPLSVHLRYRVVPAYDLIERSVAVENRGDQPIALEQVMSALWSFPLRDGYRLRTLVGKWGAETQVQDIPVSIGKHVVESRRGHTSHTANPWFGLDPEGKSDETQGEVWFGALAYSGNWKFVLERTDLGLVTLAGGVNDFDFRWQLEAGDTFAAPVFVAGYTDGGYGAASRLLHGYQLDHVLPKAFAHQVRPILYNSWYVTHFDVNQENQIAAAERAAALGVELFVVDDGWFGARKNDTAGLGDWWVDREKFPNGLGPLIRRVNELGMGFGIWVEPEMVNPDSDLYRAHPDWVYHFPNRRRSEQRNQLVLNFGRQDVQEHIFAVLDALLSDHKIAFIKWDMNRPFSEPGWPDAPVGHAQEVWVRHVWGLYQILDRLRARHPQVLFESCSGGGGRVDLGILQRTDQVWTSDNTDPYDYLFMAEGHSMAYSPKTRMMWVTDSRNPSDRLLPLQFRFHASMTGALGVGATLLDWSNEEMEEARQQIALYKEIREAVQHGDLYRLRSPRESVLAALQYVQRDGAQAVVFVFLQSARFGPMGTMLRLQGLEPDGRYRVEGQDGVLSGAGLMKRGLPVALRGDYTSRLIRVFRVA